VQDSPLGQSASVTHSTLHTDVITRSTQTKPGAHSMVPPLQSATSKPAPGGTQSVMMVGPEGRVRSVSA
jgi:hypothetical protein